MVWLKEEWIKSTLYLYDVFVEIPWEKHLISLHLLLYKMRITIIAILGMPGNDNEYQIGNAYKRFSKGLK